MMVGPLTQRRLGERMVNPVGLGCMNLSWAYAPPPPVEVAMVTLNQALDLGYDHLDTARLYGAGANELLLGEALKGRRQEFFLASKTGLFAKGSERWVDCSPATIAATCEESLKALQTDHIDLYYLHRRDFDVPIEESAGALARLVEAGKIGGYGLSEMSAETVTRAHQVHPVRAVQVEYSLWTRNPEIALLEATRVLGIALVAFSPVARGAFANGLRDPATLTQNDLRRHQPRFNAGNWPKNLALVDRFNAIADREGVTPAQLSLAWVLSRGPHVHVIPGSANPAHISENIARSDWQVPPAVIAELNAIINEHTVSGPRYPAAMQAMMDSEEFVASV